MWSGDVHCSFQRVGELKSTQRDTFVLSTSSVLSLCRLVLSLLVILAAGFYIPFSGKNALLTPKSRGWRGALLTPVTQHSVSRWGWPRLHHPQTRSLKVISWADWLEKARFTQRPSKESVCLQDMDPNDLPKLSRESQPQSSAFSVRQGAIRMEIQWGYLWQSLG